MKWISFNIVSICLLALAAYLIHLNRSGWGWCVFAAILLAVVPASKSDEKDD